MTVSKSINEFYAVGLGACILGAGILLYVHRLEKKNTLQWKQYTDKNPIVINVGNTGYRGYVCAETPSMYVLKSTDGFVYNIQKSAAVVKISKETPSEDPR